MLSRNARLGDYLIALAYIDDAMLESALSAQRQALFAGDPRALGDILVAQGRITNTELVAVLLIQQADRGSFEQPTRAQLLGRYLVQQRIVSDDELAAGMLERARRSLRGQDAMLGAILLELGMVTRARLEQALR